MTKLHYGNIKYTDIANGLGVRVSLFVSGCENCCPECFQPETWDPCYGEPFTAKVLDNLLVGLAKPYIDGLTLLGGDPFYPANVEEIAKIIAIVKEKFGEAKNIWLYSGYTYEELLARRDTRIEKILKSADVLVDGRFIIAQKDISLKFRGSKNQRLIDLKKTSGNTVVELNI